MPDMASTHILGFITRRFPQAVVTESEDIFSLGYISSLFAVELVMFIEKTFTIRIPDDELLRENFRTVEAMASLVGRLQASAAAV